MQVTETNAEGLRREFKVVISAHDFQSKLDNRLEEMGRNMRLPGFRPGKVPLTLLKQRYGQSVMGEIVERTISDSSTRLMTDRGLRPAGEPRIEILSFAEGADLEFKMAVELIPDIQPTDFAALKLERLKVAVDDAEVEEAVKRIAERQRRSEPVTTGRAAEKGDIIVLDFVGRIDGAEFPSGKGEGSHLELGSGAFLPGFEDQLVGSRAGEEREIRLTFPADYPNKELAGKDAVFTVQLKELRQPVAMPVDDDLAKSLGLENLEALRRSAREQTERDYAALARGRLKRQLLDALAASHEFALPAGMVDAEFEAIWRQIDADRQQGRLDPEDEGKTEEQLKSEYRDIAARRVKLGLLLSEVGRLNNIQVTNDELTRAVMSEARRYQGQERKIVDYYQKTPQALAQLRAPIYEDKVVDFILELAQPTERTVSVDELKFALAAIAAPIAPTPAGKAR